MADDLQIKAVPSPNGSNAGANPASNGSVPTKNTLPSQVIDLRGLDQNAQNASTPTAASPSGVAPMNPNSGNTATGSGVLGGTGVSGQTTVPTNDDTYTSANGQTYTIPANVREKFPDLMKLIKETESMNDEEREYWFQILPIMTEDQIKKFRDILVNEKEQLAKLDKEYETELTKLNEKHMVEWKAFESKEKRKALTQAEQKSKAEEQSQEEDLLKRLSQV